MDEKYKAMCECCEREFEYTKDNVLIQDFGCANVICPHCKASTPADDVFNLKLDENNLVFPQHFFEFCEKEENSILDEEINKEIKKHLKLLREKEKDTNFECLRFGNILIFIFKNNETFSIFVAKGYYYTEF